jgi:hypothetical protein
MADHTVRMTPDTDGYATYALVCHHGDDVYWSTVEDGSRTPGPYECWIRSWFDELGGELLGAHDAWPTFEFPVRLDGGNGWDDAPILVPEVD